MNDNEDMLRKIFEMQTELNNYVFTRNQLVDNNGGSLTMASIFSAASGGKLKVNELPNQWLSNYSKAMREEINELDADLLWKWWSKDQIYFPNFLL